MFFPYARYACRLLFGQAMASSKFKLVVDNGGCSCRLGWANEECPSLVSLNATAQQRGNLDVFVADQIGIIFILVLIYLFRFVGESFVFHLWIFKRSDQESRDVDFYSAMRSRDNNELAVSDGHLVSFEICSCILISNF